MTTTDHTTSKQMTDDEIEVQAGINYDALNILEERLEQVSAMLMIIHGNGELSGWSKGVQDNYLWACSTMVEQAKEMADKINLSTVR